MDEGVAGGGELDVDGERAAGVGGAGGAVDDHLPVEGVRHGLRPGPQVRRRVTPEQPQLVADDPERCLPLLILPSGRRRGQLRLRLRLRHRRRRHGRRFAGHCCHLASTCVMHVGPSLSAASCSRTCYSVWLERERDRGFMRSTGRHRYIVEMTIVLIVFGLGYAVASSKLRIG